LTVNTLKMFSFTSAVLAAVLIANTEARTTSLRPEWTRDLSFTAIGSFAPRTQVTDHANIDRDQAAMETQLGVGLPGFPGAQDIYSQGSFSKSIGVFTLTDGSPISIEAKTKVSGLTDSGAVVVGTATSAINENGPILSLQYSTTDEAGTTCNVGGNPEPVFDGCFAASGELTVEGSDIAIPYTYVREDTSNGRTIRGFSTSAENKMRAFDTQEYYADFQKFVDYYGTATYADEWITAGFDGVQTQFTNGNGDFTAYSPEARTQIIKKGTAYMSIAMYVIRELEDAVDDCNKNCATCNDDSVHALDEAVAFYTGSLEIETPGDGKLMHKLADKRCVNFSTCGRNGDSVDGQSKVNFDLFTLFSKMQNELTDKNCKGAEKHKEEIVNKMMIPLVQGTIRYAHITENDPDATQKEEAEGAVFAAAVLPMVNACNDKDATTIFENMKTGQAGTADFAAVKKAFERNYGCLGITCADVGGLWNTGLEAYEDGANPCSSSGASVGVIVGATFGALFALVVAVICIKKRRSATSADMKADAGQIS